jgi:hypothetical protein|tara:strand:+ start:1488 stop:1751 length:264 start_codon:yes stop_codon:yes gene_type:complete
MLILHPLSIALDSFVNSASNLSVAKQVAGPDYVIHSFRHSMRDRVRAVNCPSDMIDQIGGWASGKIGVGYGEGYSLVRKWEWLREIN